MNKKKQTSSSSSSDSDDNKGKNKYKKGTMKKTAGLIKKMGRTKKKTYRNDTSSSSSEDRAKLKKPIKSMKVKQVDSDTSSD